MDTEVDDNTTLDLDTIFPEPNRPPTPEPTFSTYTRTTTHLKSEIKIRLVGNHPLWAHHLWNASRSFASFLDKSNFCKDRKILELGAGGGLPSVIAVLNGASNVVITDYPDTPLIENVRYNVSQNVPDEIQDRVSVVGYIWGQDIVPLLPPGGDGFDVIILSDLIFNHSQHDALLNTCDQAISKSSSACVLVFYTHHRPHLAHRDMEFFEKAQSRGWIVDEVVKETFPPMFPEDSGDETIRSTVHGYKLTKP